MNNKLNIEELKYLVPDYITGQLSDADKASVEEALTEFVELREFHNELKGTFEFVNTVKFEEPSPQYFSNLLPRIHQRIEEQESRKFSWDKIASMWKVLVPVAAIVVIALVYYMVKQSDTQMTKDEQKKIENINKDTNKDKQPDKKESEVKQPENNQDNIVKEKDVQKPDNTVKERKAFKIENDNTAKDETPVNNDNNEQIPVKEEMAAIEIEDTSVFSTGEGAGIDEELENDLKKLDNKELDLLLNELLKSNL
jgi:multidrug efflux pump subunit AcrB